MVTVATVGHEAKVARNKSMPPGGIAIVISGLRQLVIGKALKVIDNFDVHSGLE
jgi:hypothetical protein